MRDITGFEGPGDTAGFPAVPGGVLTVASSPATEDRERIGSAEERRCCELSPEIHGAILRISAHRRRRKSTKIARKTEKQRPGKRSYTRNFFSFPSKFNYSIFDLRCLVLVVHVPGSHAEHNLQV